MYVQFTSCVDWVGVTERSVLGMLLFKILLANLICVIGNVYISSYNSVVSDDNQDETQKTLIKENNNFNIKLENFTIHHKIC